MDLSWSSIYWTVYIATLLYLMWVASDEKRPEDVVLLSFASVLLALVWPVMWPVVIFRKIRLRMRKNGTDL